MRRISCSLRRGTVLDQSNLTNYHFLPCLDRADQDKEFIELHLVDLHVV